MNRMKKNTDLVVLKGWPFILTGEEAKAILKTRKLKRSQESMDLTKKEHIKKQEPKNNKT